MTLRQFLHVKSIVTDLPPVFARFYGDEANTTCHKCGRKHAK